MTDIRLEITGSSIPNVRILGGQFYYKVKTCWCHEIEISENKEDGGRYFVKLPSISLIDHFKVREEGVQIFLEVWHKYLDDEKYKKIFLGFTKLKIGDQLLSPKLNPSIKWLDIYNPIDDHHAGKILIEVFAKFVHPETLETYEKSSRSSFGGEKVANKKSPSSAYFNLTTNTNSSSSGTAACSGRNGKATPKSSSRSIEKQRNVEHFTSVDDLRNSFARLRDQVPTLYNSFDLLNSEENSDKCSNSRTNVPTDTAVKEKIRLFREQQEAYLIPNKEKDNNETDNKIINKKQPRKYLTSEQILGQEFSPTLSDNRDPKQIGDQSNHETENVITFMKKKSKTFTTNSNSSSVISSNETDIIELTEEFDRLKASIIPPKSSKSKTTQTNKKKKSSNLILQENKTRNILHSNSNSKEPNCSTSINAQSTNANSIKKRRTMAANFNF